MNGSYSRETVDAKLDSIHDTMKAVLSQVERTNGRVQTLEKWRVGLTVGLGVLAAMSLPNVSIIAKTLSGL